MDKLKYIDDWLEDGWNHIISKSELAYSSYLGMTVYHVAINTTDEVGQHFEIRYKGKNYRVDFAQDIIPKIKALIRNS